MFFWGKKKKQDTVRAKEFILEDSEGRERVHLSMGNEDSIVLSFKDEKGKTRLYMGLTQDGTPRLGLEYAEGKGSIQLEANDKLNSAALIIVGASGKAQVLLGVAQNGHPAIALYDNDGKQVFPATPPTEDGHLNDDLGGFDWDDILRKHLD